jgi:type II secretory pathway pseudopilin PulG
MDRPRPSSEAGFTIVEALIAMVVLVFGLVAITNLMIVAASSNSAANLSTAATARASEQLERLKATDFTTLAAAAGGDVDSDAPGYFRDDTTDPLAPNVPLVPIKTRWQISAVTGDNQTLFIHVVSQPTGGFLLSRARADFTTFRSCTNTLGGCPNP